MDKKQEKAGENKVVRDEKGRVVSGTPNPYGRPKGAGISIVTELKRKLAKCPPGEDKATYLQLLLNKIMEKALEDGDTAMIRDIINRVDGMPNQKIGGDPENPTPIMFMPSELLLKNKLGNDINGSSESNS